MKLIVIYCLLLAVLSSQGNKPIYTQVTCLYDIKRENIGNDLQKRSFQFYLQYFDSMLLTDSNLIIFGSKYLEEYVWNRRRPHNTVFVPKEIESFKEMWFYPVVQSMRQKRLKNDSFILKGHPSHALEYYNILMFSKIYMVEWAMQYDKFNSDYLIWTDGGLNHVFPGNLVYPVNHLKNWFEFIQPQWLFFSFYFEGMYKGYANSSVRYVGVDITQIVLGGFYGGYTEAVRDARCTFENFLRITLQSDDMYSDECVLSMMPIKYPFLFPIKLDGYFNQVYGKLHVHMNSNRKPEYSRFFRGDFDSEGHIYAIESKSLTKYVIIEKEEVQPPESPTTIQLMYYRQADQVNEIIRTNLAFSKKICLREAAYLFLMAILYVLVKIRTRKQKKQVEPIPQPKS